MAISPLTIKPRRSAAKKQGEKLWVEHWVVWRDEAFRELRCPACATTSVMEKTLDASPPFEPRKRYALYRCRPCGTLHYPDAPVFAYESRKDADIARSASNRKPSNPILKSEAATGFPLILPRAALAGAPRISIPPSLPARAQAIWAMLTCLNI